ncbi:MAG: DUF427 domain-containing protein [Candidatus Nanopelagicales bacterium]
MVNQRLPSGVVPVAPGPGQTSVWDFPRPPIVVSDDRTVVVRFANTEICRTNRALKVLETSHPPTWYLPVSSFIEGSLSPGQGSSVCEYKGPASYFDVSAGDRRAASAAWGYLEPWNGLDRLRGHVALYAASMDRVTVDGETIRPQPGGFYGGWITDDVVGPFKGVPGSFGW